MIAIFRRLLAVSMLSAVAAWATAPAAENEYQKVTFEQLASYPFTPPQYDPAAKGKPATGEEQIPAEIKALNGRKVVITGFMVPVKIDQGLVTELLLMRNTLACCFGTVPNMNEWVVIKMRRGIQPMMDVPVSFFGDLKVAAIFDNGYLTGLYQLDGEKMEAAKQ